MKNLFQWMLGMSMVSMLFGSNAVMAEGLAKLRLRVVSFNIRQPVDKEPFRVWSHRKKLVLKDLQRMNPDLFGLQEAKPEQITDLEEFGYRHIGHGRNRDLTGEAVPVFYDPRRFDVVEARTLWLSKTPQVYSLSEGATLPRIVTIGVFREKASGREFVFANTHLHHRNQEVCHPEQIRAILNELTPYIRRGMAVFLTGDFNSAPTGIAYREAAKVFRDAYLSSEQKPVQMEERTFHGFGRKRFTPGYRIDFIWVSPDVKVLRYESVNNFDERDIASSDHYPQLAEVEL